MHISSNKGNPGVELGMFRIILGTGLTFINLKIYSFIKKNNS